MTKNAFFSEYFSIPEIEYKSTPYLGLHVTSSDPLKDFSKETTEMLQKIVGLFPSEFAQWSKSEVTDSIHISQLLQNTEIKILLCFVEQELVKSLQISHTYKGFQDINHKRVIFLPPISEFTQNQKAKKYLWQSIQNTFKQ